MGQPYHFFVRFQRPDLIGREEALVRLHATLREGDAAVTPALVGQGGIGKTQLAVCYCHDFGGAANYPGGVFWLNCADPTPRSLLGQMASYADQMGLAPRDLGGDADEVDRRLARIWVGEVRRRPGALLVLDNLEEPGLLARDLPGVPGARLPALGCRLLVTSRQCELLPGVLTDIPVDLLGPEMSRALLLREAGRAPDGEGDGEAVAAVCGLLGGLPLALRLAGALLRRYRMAFGAFVEMLRGRGAVAVLSERGVPLDNYRDNLPVTMRALLAESWDALPGDRPELRSILLALGCLPEARVVRVKLLRHLVELPAEACPFGDPWEEALGELARVNLIERPEEGQVRLHPLVHDYARGQAGNGIRAAVVARAAASLRNPAYLAGADAEELLTLLRELPMLEGMADGAG